jgi:isopentenyl-diphosphate delta-isomerase
MKVNMYMMQEVQVVQVDENDNDIRFVPKLEAHYSGVLHRAVSVLIFDTSGRWMLQKRADNKYHSSGLWSNTCCSHPFPNEDVKVAAERRLLEEMGIYCPLKKQYSFQYKAEFENGLIEHELDHVFVGVTDDTPNPNHEEVSEWKMISTDDLKRELKKNPEEFSEWFKMIVPEILKTYYPIVA